MTCDCTAQRGGHVEVEVDAKPGPGRQRQMPAGGIDARMPVDDILRPGVVEGVEMFLDEEVRCAEGNLEAGGE